MTQDSKEVVLEFYRRWDAASPSWDDIVSEDFTVHFGGIPRAFSRTEMGTFNKEFWACFSERSHVWEKQLVEGDIVASRGTFTATCSGEIGGAEVAGKAIILDAFTHHRVADGRVIEEWLSVSPQMGRELPTAEGEPMRSLLAAVLPAG